jgi:azurin
MSLNSSANPARVSLLALVLVLAAPGSASADTAAARACASTLSAEGRMMFEAAAAKVKPGSNLRDVMMSEVRGLVMSGKLSRDIAQKNGAAVGECLKKLQS